MRPFDKPNFNIDFGSIFSSDASTSQYTSDKSAQAINYF